MSDAYTIVRPRPGVRRRPILLSSPHSGTEIPADLRAGMVPHLAEQVPDTDWFVHELYAFAADLGITTIKARFSRFVVDLNRDPSGAKLYADGRQETGLVPVRTFAGDKLYVSKEPTAAEVEQRVQRYYEPYHAAIGATLAELRREFPQVLLYDAHSIKRVVKTIQQEAFPDMILGDRQGQSAMPTLSVTALSMLRRSGRYDVAHNHPFMGGYITRHFGQPASGVHTLQLEMSQDIYMNETAASRDATKQGQVAAVLRDTLEALAQALEHA